MEENNLQNGNKATKKAKGNVPRADLDLSTTAKNVADNWRIKSEFVLHWTSVDYFLQKAEEFKNKLEEKIFEESKRPEITKKLSNLDKKIDQGVIYIKVYLKDLFGEDDKSHYPQYGITRINRSYFIPKDRDIRVSALSLILQNLVTDGLQNKPFGTDYWQAIKTEYDALKLEASELDEVVTAKVNEKNILRNDLKKHLQSLIFLIKANFPDTYKSELRSWGFQKEKY